MAPKPTIGFLTSPMNKGFSESEWDMMGIMSVLEDMNPIIEKSDPSTQATYHRVRTTLTAAFQRPLDPAYHLQRDSITAKTEWLNGNGFYGAFLASVQLVGGLWPGITASDTHVANVHERWMRCRKLEPYVIQLKERYEGAGGMARQVCAVERLGRLFLELACYYSDFSNHSQAQIFISTAISVCDNAEKAPPGPVLLDRVQEFMPLRADIHGLQAAIATETGDAVDAVEYAQRQLNLQIQLANRQRTSKVKVAKAKTDLAMALMVGGRYDDAGTALNEVEDAATNQAGIEIQKVDASIDLQHKPIFARAWLAYLKGDLDDAWTLFSDLRTQRESMLGINDKEGVLTGEILYALANISLLRNDMQTSLSTHLLAIRQFENTVGVMHACTAKASFKLAGLYLRLGDWESAGVLLEQAERFYEVGGWWRGECERVRFWSGGLGVLRGEVGVRGGEVVLGDGGGEFDGKVVCWAR